jgi:hypothetical protein
VYPLDRLGGNLTTLINSMIAIGPTKKTTSSVTGANKIPRTPPDRRRRDPAVATATALTREPRPG